jgi:hypothetical protein
VHQVLRRVGRVVLQNLESEKAGGERKKKKGGKQTNSKEAHTMDGRTISF